MSRQPLTRRQRVRLTVGSIVLAILVLALAGAGYANYRINRFSDSVFRDEATPPQTQYGAVDPTPLPTTTATPAPPTPTRDPRDTNTPTPAPPTPTATPSYTPTATPLPYGNSPVIKRLRAG